MDRDLVVRAQQGDRRAFDTLTVTDYPRLFRVAHSILRDRSQAEDATQQAYFDTWRNIRRLRSPAAFEGWSYRILVHACHAEARRRPRWVPDSELPSASQPKAADEFAAVLDRDELERAFGRLTIDQRVVIVLHFHLDMTLEQVAKTLGIPKGTVNSRLSRAMRVMRTALRADTRSTAPMVRQEVTR
jgi:RNA polymerase sigma-70 factor (ECF subfamily)